MADDDALLRELLRLVNRVSTDLRSRGYAAGTIAVKLRDFDFTTRRASRTLDRPVVADRVIMSTARELLAKLRKARRVPARLLGVGLGALVERDEPVQLPLFDQTGTDDESARDRQIATTLDRVRERFGSQSIVPARLAKSRALSTVEEDEIAQEQRGRKRSR
ncbi:MAG: hypothetical protein U0163_11395 [Gemmatimonadaceae bacterium]